MSSTTGIAPVGNYVGSATAGAAIDRFLAILPNLDSPGSSGSQAGGGNLDEMSPGAVAQIRVDLAAMRAVVAAFA